MRRIRTGNSMPGKTSQAIDALTVDGLADLVEEAARRPIESPWPTMMMRPQEWADLWRRMRDLPPAPLTRESIDAMPPEERQRWRDIVGPVFDEVADGPPGSPVTYWYDPGSSSTVTYAAGKITIGPLVPEDFWRVDDRRAGEQSAPGPATIGLLRQQWEDLLDSLGSAPDSLHHPATSRRPNRAQRRRRRATQGIGK